jgi:hypothetical protein
MLVINKTSSCRGEPKGVSTEIPSDLVRPSVEGETFPIRFRRWAFIAVVWSWPAKGWSDGVSSFPFAYYKEKTHAKFQLRPPIK